MQIIHPELETAWGVFIRKMRGKLQMCEGMQMKVRGEAPRAVNENRFWYKILCFCQRGGKIMSQWLG